MPYWAPPVVRHPEDLPEHQGSTPSCLPVAFGAWVPSDFLLLRGDTGHSLQLLSLQGLPLLPLLGRVLTAGKSELAGWWAVYSLPVCRKAGLDGGNSPGSLGCTRARLAFGRQCGADVDSCHFFGWGHLTGPDMSPVGRGLSRPLGKDQHSLLGA